MRTAVAILSALALLLGCKGPAPVNPGAVTVATAYGESLTVADLQAEMPPRLTAEDSAAWADRLIADWQQRRTVVHLAGNCRTPSGTSNAKCAATAKPSTSTLTRTATCGTTSTRW